MNILVTGGRGFVGSRLVRRLIQNRHKVFVVDNDLFNQNRERIDGVIYYDVCVSKLETNELPKLDVIFHLGEYSRVEQSFQDIDLVLKNNVGNFSHILALWRAHGSKLIYSASSTKFGVGSSVSSLASPYSMVKAFNAELVMKYADWYKLNYAISYFYNVYGPGEIRVGKYSTVVEKFLTLAEKGVPLPIHGTGEQVRNFTHIDDIVSGLELIMAHGVGDGFGIGSDECYSIKQLAEMIGSETYNLPQKLGNRENAKLTNQKIKNLGWVEKYNLQTYILNRLSNFNQQ